MPVRGVDEEAALAPLHDDARAWLGNGVRWLDVHTHIGHHDPDGLAADAHELLAALDGAGQQEACVFAMHEPDGYRAANDEVLRAVRESGGRLRALARVSPHAPDAAAELERCLDAGARGLKLHPRSEGFAMDHPAVESLVARVAARRGVVLVHAGRGIPELGVRIAEMAAAHADARFVLAHAGISDLGLLRDAAAALPNLLFDTAWWHPADLLALLTTVPPARVLYASDMPYGPPLTAAILFLRCARQAGLSRDAVREMAGPQAARALVGEALLDLGPAPGPEALGPRVLSFERAGAYLTAAIQLTFRGGDVSEAYALARLACQRVGDEAPHAAELSVVEAYIAAAQERLAATGDPYAAVPLGLAALAIAATPSVPAPTLPV